MLDEFTDKHLPASRRPSSGRAKSRFQHFLKLEVLGNDPHSRNYLSLLFQSVSLYKPFRQTLLTLYTTGNVFGGDKPPTDKRIPSLGGPFTT